MQYAWCALLRVGLPGDNGMTSVTTGHAASCHVGSTSHNGAFTPNVWRFGAATLDCQHTGGTTPHPPGNDNNDTYCTNINIHITRFSFSRDGAGVFRCADAFHLCSLPLT